MHDLFVVKFTFVKNFEFNLVGDTIETSVSVCFERDYRFSANLVIQRARLKLFKECGVPHYVLRFDAMERV